jgi:NitT/TauT family transport system ATP-binding protein
MRQRVGFARALVVEPEVLFMDEPFSALDVLTAENLRSELLELWANKTMPTKAIFIVTHNIEEAVLLADRIIVLGRNPGHIRTDFKVQLPQPRDRKSEPFTNLVDYIYKVLTRPDVAPAPLPTRPPAAPSATSARCTTRCCPTPAPAASPACSNCSSTKAARRHLPPRRRPRLRNRRPAAHRRRRPAPRLPQNRRRRRRHHPQRRRVRQLRNPAPERALPRRRRRNVLLLRQIRRALESKSDHTVPEDFFLDMLDEQFSEDESQRQMETAVNWGRYAELFDFDAARRRFILPDAQEEEIPPPPARGE